MAQLGRYTLLRRVGVGGMAEVWKAKVLGPAGFEKVVAVKTILPHLLGDLEFIDMFVEEAKLVAQLVHPNIVQVLDFGLSENEDGRSDYYITMEYVAGQNLSTILKRLHKADRSLRTEVALFLMAETAKALGYAHNEIDIVHRDVSPHNVLVSYRGEVKVTDFGIAKVASALPRTGAGMRKGKIAYMSPEQAQLLPVTPRSDVFSLGILLYEVITGDRLFFGKSSDEVFGMLTRFEKVDDEALAPMPPSVRMILEKALQLDAANRYEDATAMQQALVLAIGQSRMGAAKEALVGVMSDLFEAEQLEEAEGDSFNQESGEHRTQSWMRDIMEAEAAADIPTRIQAANLEPAEDRTTRLSEDGIAPVARAKAQLPPPDPDEPSEHSLSFVISEDGVVPQIREASSKLADEDELVEPFEAVPEADDVDEEEGDTGVLVMERRPTKKSRTLWAVLITAGLALAMGASLPTLIKRYDSWTATPTATRVVVATATPTATSSATLTPAPVETSTAMSTAAATSTARVVTPTRTSSPTRVSSATPEQTSSTTPAPVRTPRPTARRTPRPTPRRTPIVKSTPRPKPTPIPRGPTGFLTIRARPWVQVWVDGKKVSSETPLRRYELKAGRHQLRFINPDLDLKLDHTVVIPTDDEVAFFVNVKKGSVDAR